MENIYLLPSKLEISLPLRRQLEEDYEKFSVDGMPKDFEQYVLEKYHIDISSRYGRFSIRNPFGMASGQITTNSSQIRNGAEDGIGFIVLKTVISQDEEGNSTMSQWKVHAPKMVVEEIKSRNGESGYTVTWKGRGWDKSFGEYLDFTAEALEYGKKCSVPVIPSCKFNLPTCKGEQFNQKEYAYTLDRLISVWKEKMGDMPVHLEKDFSPTLAGSELSKEKEVILWWLQNIVSEIKKNSGGNDLCLGVKLMNAVFDDDFQMEILKTSMNARVLPDFLVCFNRLFDSNKEFEGKKGVAYGGYDLSDRNLKVLSSLRRLEQRGEIKMTNLPISATGNIESGKMILEYALRGSENGQIHTYFQIPASNYAMKSGSRIQKALHELIFNPEKGLISGMVYLNEKGLLEQSGGVLHFSDVVEAFKNHLIFKDWTGEII